MPLDTADTFTDTDDTTTTPPASYPPAPPLAPLSFLLGYTEPSRTRYTTQNQATTARLLSLTLTPAEAAALTHYDSIFYAYESYGDVLGSGAGALLGLALQSRKPGRVPTALARMFRASPRVVAVALRIAVFGTLGRLYGMSSAGVQALNRIRGEQRADPAMARVVAARARRLDDLTRGVRMRGEGRRQDRDEQGVEAFEQARAADDTFPDGRPSELVAQQGAVAEERHTDDPFLLTDERGPQQQQGGWKNNHSGTGESAWERLRKGQQPPPPPPEDEPQSQSQSPWPRRPPMKGFGSPGDREPKTDSFSFSGTAEDRELAKAQAQKEFDESLERERRSGGEGEGGRGRW